MKPTDKMKPAIGVLTVAGVALALGTFAVPGRAQQPPATPASVEQPVAQASTSGAERASAKNGASFLSLTEISNRISSEGLKVTELEIHDKVVEVEARDSSNRELDLVVDRRTGEILSREFDD